jgi:hypothetical protein
MRFGLINFLVPAFLLGISVTAFSQMPGVQQGDNLPSIVPASPEVASLSKAGNFSTGLHTGSANAQIPLYEISVGRIKVPISLSYSTNGTKVSEIASRVGLGWNLLAGGVISKTIHDDEDGQSTYLTPPNFTIHNQALMDYLFYAGTEGYDTEFDEYSFSVNGLSGRFFLDASGNPRIASHSNIRIMKISNSFVITSADGIAYHFFSSDIEQTTDVKTNAKDRLNLTKTTGWFLSKIVSPEGDEVVFNYAAIATKTIQGSYQSVVLKSTAPVSPQECNFCEEQWAGVGLNRVNYNTKYLTSIVSSNGQTVEFSYIARPEVATAVISGDNRLNQVKVWNSNNSVSQPKLIKQFQLEYLDFVIGGDLNQRFYLKKVLNQSVSGSAGVLTHEFEYNNPAQLPSQKSNAQDYFGYFNGIPNSNLFPRPDNYLSYYNAGSGANRSPNAEATQAGTLKKILYPTGGSQEFEYEPHTLNQIVSDSIFTKAIYLSHVGTGVSTISTYTRTITISSQPLRISYVTEWNALGPAPGQPGYNPPDGIHFLSYLEIWHIATNTRVFEARHRNYEGSDLFPHLAPGQYEVRLMVAGNSHHSYGSIKYDPIVQTVPVNVEGCGLRVKQIKSYDPVSNQTLSKFYKYASIQDLSKSSGIGFLKTVNQAGYPGGGVCSEGFIGETILDCSNLMQVSSSSLSNTPTFGGSPIAYQYVVESDDEDVTNGGVEHRFHTVIDTYSPIPLINNSLPGTGSNLFPDMNGYELETRYFATRNAQFITLREQINQYGSDSRAYSVISNYITRKRWAPPTQSNFSYSDKLRGYDVSQYDFRSGWYKLNTTINKEYDQNGQNPLVTTINYEYNNHIHTLPTYIKTYNSKGQLLEQTNKYPADFATQPYTDMVMEHMISPVIEQQNLTNNVNTIAVSNQYLDFGSNSSVFRPEFIKVANGPQASPETRVQYHSYDTKGNPLEVSKKNDVRITYLWNYKKTYPVAEIKNASFADVAYTGFEGDDNGNWTFNVNSIAHGGITGTKQYSGTVTRQTNTAIRYSLSVWAKGTVTVNSAPGTVLDTRSGWTLYQWTISNTSNVTVQGTQIDELRLHPESAQMVSYCYNPFIGLSAKSDENNRITYYEYDGFNRLSMIRDVDRNVLKKYCYNYVGQQQECGAPVFGNIVKSGTFTRNNCGTNGTGVTVTYQVPAGTYTALTQSAADALAQADVDNNGQTYANQQAGCSWGNQLQSVTYTRNNCVDGGTGGQATYSINAFSYSSTVSLAAANQQALNAANAGGQAYANSNATCTWTNQPQSGSFTRNNCGNNGVGNTMTYSVNAGSFSSTTSLADANQLALAHVNSQGQNYVNANAGCTWYNVNTSQVFYKSCGAGYEGSSVTYTVPAGTYSSTDGYFEVVQATQADINANGQNYANTNGTCTLIPCTTNNCQGNDKKCINGVCETGNWAVVSSVWKRVSGVFQWECTWRYCFSDGSQSTYSSLTYSSTACPITCVIPL